MATEPTISARAAWHHLVAQRDCFIHTLATQGRNSDLERRIAAVEEQLLQTPAGSLADITLKLELLWGDLSHPRDADSRAKALLLDELRGLAVHS